MRRFSGGFDRILLSVSSSVMNSPHVAGLPQVLFLVAAVLASGLAGPLLASDAPNMPGWVRDGVIYQIFVDRFRDGDPSNNDAGARRDFKSANPGYEPETNFYGGDLAGVRESLDYLDDLGVGVLWLTPIHPGPWYHGYHVTDHMDVDPHFGTLDDMKALVEEAHSRGIRVLLDLVANHVSERHRFFADARQRRESPYHDWFTWHPWPTDWDSFFYFKDLPKLNLSHGPTRDYMMDVGRFWLREVGVDGYRLDYAPGPGKDFWRDFRREMRTIRPDVFLIGEIWEDASTIASYLGSLDGAMDFPRSYIFREFFARNEKSVSEFDKSLRDVRGIYGNRPTMGSFIGNHDLPRYLVEARGDVWRMYVTLIAQMTMDQVPVVYYGDEAFGPESFDLAIVNRKKADQGGASLNDEEQDQATRKPMVWGGDQRKDLHTLHRSLIRLRNSMPVLTRGGIDTVLVQDGRGLYGYRRTFEGRDVHVVLNNSSFTATASLDIPSAGRGPVVYRDLLGKRTLTARNGHVSFEVLGHWGAVLVREDPRARELAAAFTIPAPVEQQLRFDTLHKKQR